MGGFARAPWTLKTYVVVSLGWALIAFPILAFGDPTALSIGIGIASILIAGLICFFLLRGSEPAWWIVFALSALSLPTSAIPPRPAWYLIAGEALLVLLLVAPATRRHCGIGGWGT